MPRRLPRRHALTAVAGGLVASLAVAGCADGEGMEPEPSAAHGSSTGQAQTDDAATAEELVAAVRPERLQADLDALERIAREHGGNRATGTPGEKASVDYAAAQLEEAGYAVERQPFEITYRENVKHEFTLHGADGGPVDYTVLRYSPAIEAEDAPLVEPVAAGGCSAAAWEGADLAGAVALVSTDGSCDLSRKSAVAERLGAVGVVFYDEDVAGPLYDSLGYAHEDHAGAVAVSSADGKRLRAAARAGATVDLRVEEIVERRTVENVIAETPHGSDEDVVVVGAHLDSVPFGPGVHDNASGVAAVLELARRTAGAEQQGSRVRFALWGAEEIGLRGARHYVGALTDAEAADVALYVNADMVAPSDDADPIGVLSGSGRPGAERLLLEQLQRDGEDSAVMESEGWSDFGPFRWAGIPATGVFSQDDEHNHAPEDGGQNVSPERHAHATRALGNLVGSLMEDPSALDAR